MNATVGTPIFDEVMREQGVDMMPLPPMKTHEDFMRAHGQEDYLARAELILRGTIKPGNGRDPKTGKFLPKGGGVPVKKKRRE